MLFNLWLTSAVLISTHKFSILIAVLGLKLLLTDQYFWRAQKKEKNLRNKSLAYCLNPFQNTTLQGVLFDFSAVLW